LTNLYFYKKAVQDAEVMNVVKKNAGCPADTMGDSFMKKETALSFPVLSRKCLPEKQEGKLLVWLLVTANIGLILVVVLLSPLVLVTLSKIPPCPMQSL
jgi:hypothetical protein